MSTRENPGSRGTDGSKTRNKGESQQSQQKGAKSVSNDRGRHKADESDGASRNTTKKQSNSI